MEQLDFSVVGVLSTAGFGSWSEDWIDEGPPAMDEQLEDVECRLRTPCTEDRVEEK